MRIFTHFFFLATLFLATLFLQINDALAHEQSVARISIVEEMKNKKTSSYQLLWQVSLKDLNRVQNFDDNSDQNIDWSEVKENKVLLEKIATTSIALNSSNGKCSMLLNDVSAIELYNGYALNLNLTANCNNELEKIEYRFLDGLDSLHVAEININTSTLKMKKLLNHSEYSVELSNKRNSSYQQASFASFIYQGIIHIWIGIDHLLFLLILLFSSLVASMGLDGKVIAKKSFKNISIYVTAFTLAHTTTLIAASLNWLILPSWFVESFIAASVAFGAFKLLARTSVINTATVFNFGLIHGLGFASVLSDLTGDISENIVLLLGFNLGVEIGQFMFLIAIGSISFISLKLISLGKLCRIVSLPILLVASVWTIERIFDLKFIPF